MGVKLLVRALPPKGVSGPAPYDVLKRLVDELCASQLSGRLEAWSVTCQLLKQGHGLVGAVGGPAPGAAGGGLKDTWAVSFRDSPDQLFLLMRPEFKVLECEAAVMRLLEKKLEFAKQMTIRFEGHTYNKGDFVLRLCTATQAIHSTQALLGHCLEVEYLPLSSMGAAEGMMAEFVDLLRQLLATVVGPGAGAGGAGEAAAGAAGGAGGRQSLLLEVVKPSYDKYGISNQPYDRAHAAVAYSDLVVAMLSTSAANAAAAAAAGQQQQQNQNQHQHQHQQQQQPQLVK